MTKISNTLADARFASTRLANDLREQTSVLCAYPAARELPQLPA